MNSANSFWLSGLGAVLAVSVVFSLATASAQTPEPDSNTGDVNTPQAARVGSFLLYPKLAVSEIYDDNITKSDTGKQDDFITQISPSLSLRSDWNVHSLRLDANADIGRYADSDREDYEDYDLRARGEAEATRALTFSADTRYRKLHEGRGSDDVPTTAREPVEYVVTTGDFQGRYQPNRIGITVGTAIDDYNFDDSVLLDGTTNNNDDRDRTVWTAFVQPSYEIQRGYEAYVKAAYNDRNYDAATDDQGINRDSDGYNFQAGMAVELTHLIRADVALGWMEQDYADSSVKDVSGWSADTQVEYDFTRLTTLLFNLNRGIRETTSNDVSAVVTTGVGVGVEHELLRNLMLNAGLEYANWDYQGDPDGREDDRLTFSAGADYEMNRFLFGGLNYRREERDSNLSGNDYTNNVVKVTVGAQF